MTEEAFLSRWSRRKLRARAGAESVERNGALPEEPGEDAELTPDELRQLPRLEDLTAATDFTQFLRKGIPAALRKAALRRMWALDPGIRDYVGDARDYAYDWNVPGGVPGSGMIPDGDVPDLLKRVLGSGEPRSPPAEEDSSPTALNQGDDVAEPAPASGEDAVLPVASAEPEGDEVPVNTARRHGGALPV
jgi:hypothetical protein